MANLVVFGVCWDYWSVVDRYFDPTSRSRMTPLGQPVEPSALEAAIILKNGKTLTKRFYLRHAFSQATFFDSDRTARNVGHILTMS
ncbi:MAG: hypothetical protein H6995_13635 [Pseudomonadales bacterium]|nr:hypothetical protein [Pseudomonadales bacterium]